MPKIALVEDEAEAADVLASFIDRYGAEKGVGFTIVRFCNAIDFELTHQKFDLVFMDIQMPGIDGMEAASLLRTYDDQIPIIFVTNLAKYAVKGYEVGATGFIVKPATYGNLTLALDRALRTVGQNSGRTLTVSTEDGIRVIPLRKIVYIEVMKHKLTYHIEGEEPMDARGSLVQIEEELADAPVVRASKSCLLNMDQISMVRSGELVMSNGDVLRISRTHKREVVDKVTDYLGGRR